MNPFDANGWTIVFFTDFRLQWEDLTTKVVKLKSKLDPKDFVTHPDVKLLKVIDSGIRDKISVDPFAPHFSLVAAFELEDGITSEEDINAIDLFTALPEDGV